MPNTWFQFKQFTIQQENCAMKIGTDGILLGAWTNCNNSKNILDIGTGTGILALMMAQKSNAHITGIDIDKNSADQARQNVLDSPWSNRIQIIHSPAQNFNLFNKKFDLIISNPPFFQNSLQAPDNSRTQARHNESLSPEDLLNAVINLLSEQGAFSVIWPVNEGKQFTELAAQKNLFCNRVTYVKPNYNKLPHRSLMEFSFINKPIPDVEITIETGTRHQYTPEYKELTKEFYLNFY